MRSSPYKRIFITLDEVSRVSSLSLSLLACLLFKFSADATVARVFLTETTIRTGLAAALYLSIDAFDSSVTCSFDKRVRCNKSGKRYSVLVLSRVNAVSALETLRLLNLVVIRITTTRIE